MNKIKHSTNDYPCISLIGIAGAGKSTIGNRLASALGWAYMDSDNLIEALYAARLQDITDILGKEAFLDVECGMLCSIRASRCVIATGGSVVCRNAAIQHLAKLGPIIHLSLSLEKTQERIARNPERGLAIAPGQTVADLYTERLPLYHKAANIECNTGEMNPEQCTQYILAILANNYGIRPNN